MNTKTVQTALRISTALKARLQGLLQAQSLVRQLPASRGKINRNRLHALSVNNNKVFLQQTQTQATNTAIHILLDNSGSMRNQIEIANQACFALASALGNTKGINVGVTAFPAQYCNNYPSSRGNTYVTPIVEHGEKVGNGFSITAQGSTPLTESLWWLLPKLLSQKEARKIILFITDGEPDNKDTALHAIEYADKLGVEIYGIGIPPCNIESILPNKSIKLEQVEQLLQAMFGLLQNALIGKNI